MTKEWREVQNFQDEKIEVIFRKARPIEESKGRCPPLAPGVTVKDGIRYERDVALRLRDGITIYTDIYRPDGATDVPAIVAWSPYGKRAGYAGQTDVPGVPTGTFSEMAKFEGPDPAYWCHYGYAVINPDARGAGNSEGDILQYGSTEGRDCYDLVEWVAAQEWSNGKVGMSGSSWLAIIQWFAAAEQPPHLACIAPWEGRADSYPQGGVPEYGFAGALIESGMICGNGRVEDRVAMSLEYPLMNGYWEDKRPKFGKIEVPAYITAGWSHFHLHGSIEGFRRISCPHKWLRVHRDFEWPDYYTPQNLEDLRRFFDRYLKGIRNGWELTPMVRMDVMDMGEIDYQLRRPEKEFPLARTRYEKLFLDASAGQLSPEPVAQESAVSYESAKGLTTFCLKFNKDTEITGYMKLRLWVEADGADDMDLFVAVQKLDDKSEFAPTLVLGQPHPGAPGLLRVSHRELDEERSTPFEPVHTHRREQLLQPGEVVPVEIDIWPTSKFWHAGEQIRVVVSGHYIREPGWFEHFTWALRNRGQHIIHTGGRYDSHLLVPVIPRRSIVIDEAQMNVGVGAMLSGSRRSESGH
ncbi:MAG: CocE/NonD family hydrolase [Desulfatiglandaceae bacterium]